MSKGFNGAVYDIELLPDNKILVSGLFSLYSDYKAVNIIKLNSDGSIDNSFSLSGFSEIYGRTLNVAMQSDGKFLMTKEDKEKYPSPVFMHTNIFRLTTDGTYDPTFGSGGLSGFTYINNANGDVLSMEVLSGDTILATGYFLGYNGDPAYKIIKLNPDGTKDTGFTYINDFNTDIVSGTSISRSYLWSAKQFSNGKIVATGLIITGGTYSNYSYNGLYIINIDGTLYKKIDFVLQGRGLIVDSNDNFYAACNTSGETLLIKFDNEGNVLNYSTNLAITSSSIDSSGPTGLANMLKIQGDKILYASNSGLYRFNLDCTQDHTFNLGDGFKSNTTCFCVNTNNLTDIYVGGAFTSFNNISSPYFAKIKLTETDLNWIGYLNSEMYQEVYYETDHYPITVNGQDGFNLMDRYKFINQSGITYYGIKSQWEILTIILDMINLPFEELRVNFSTTFSGFTNASGNTILHETYVNTSNYLDEDGVPLSMKKVMESLLHPYGAFITQISGNLYINDVHSLANSSAQTYKCYSGGTWNYLYDITETGNTIRVQDIGYQGQSQTTEVSGGKSTQKVIYSPYVDKLLIDTCIADESEFTIVPTSYTKRDFGGGNSYWYRTLSGNRNFQVNSPATFEESYYQDSEDSQIYIRFAKQTVHSKILVSITKGYYAIAAGKLRQQGSRKKFVGVICRLTGEAMLTTKNNPYNKDEVGERYTNMKLKMGLNIGTGATAQEFWINNETASSEVNIAETWVPFTVDNMIGANRSNPFDVNGELYVDIYTDVTTISRNGEDTTPDAMKELWIKNLKVEFIDSDTNGEIDDKDVEYKSEKNSLFLDEAEKVTVYCGTDSYRADRAKLMTKTNANPPKYPAIYNWTRANQTKQLEHLLANSMASNNIVGYITLGSMIMQNKFNHINTLSDDNWSGKRMMVTAIKYDYYQNINEATLVEITPDSYSIVVTP